MMRKKMIGQDAQEVPAGNEEHLDLNSLAQVEISSEDAAYPIENALTLKNNSGWRASKAGRQTIRILFDAPQRINSIHLLFEEKQQARTQEFQLRWSPGIGQEYREIVRQQFNFSPESASREQENYTVNLENVKVVELNILPDIGGSDARATLSALWFS